MTAPHFLAGGKESLDETVTGWVTLDVVWVDVEGEGDDGVAVMVSVSWDVRLWITYVPRHMAPSR